MIINILMISARLLVVCGGEMCVEGETRTTFVCVYKFLLTRINKLIIEDMTGIFLKCNITFQAYYVYSISMYKNTNHLVFIVW